MPMTQNECADSRGAEAVRGFLRVLGQDGRQLNARYRKIYCRVGFLLVECRHQYERTMAMRVQQSGDGPLVMPAVVGYLGLALSSGGRPTQIRFVLEDGSELHLPIREVAYSKLLAQFAMLYAEIGTFGGRKN
ncbi:hypothetical protein G5V57_31430 [Nordella sp. HKS 07]|uniref:hypothetical protein n=1 Tax=Nordella sp. HKS 07 TaxID=2712222 RepID=UPI0013E1A134|nr:hypothetical protein [Nordella sp. HKS 07]QIG51824.1 hypothetical protein G5V57_31430 [Nordella sp. HKS 07]